MKNLLNKALVVALLMPTVSMMAESWYQRAWQSISATVNSLRGQVAAHPYIAAGVTAAAVGGAALAYKMKKTKKSFRSETSSSKQPTFAQRTKNAAKALIEKIKKNKVATVVTALALSSFAVVAYKAIARR